MSRLAKLRQLLWGGLVFGDGDIRSLVQLDGDVCLMISRQALTRSDLGDALGIHLNGLRAEVKAIFRFAQSTAFWGSWLIRSGLFASGFLGLSQLSSDTEFSAVVAAILAIPVGHRLIALTMKSWLTPIEALGLHEAA